MAKTARLEHLIGSRGKVAVLRHLCANPEQDFSICELADSAGVDKSLVSRLVREFSVSGIVEIRERRNLKLCQINSKSGTYNLLAEMFASEKRLLGKKEREAR